MAKSVQSAPTTPKYVVMRELARSVPRDDYGLPRYVFRPDMIHVDIMLPSMPPEEKHNYLSVASVPLRYDEGFPTFDSGDPIWHQMPWEPGLAYDAFVKYIEMPDKSPETPIRILTVLATLQKIPVEKLQEYFHEFWWRDRAQAHDLFIVACSNRQQQRRILSMNDSHYLHATGFIDLCAKYLNSELIKITTGQPSELKAREIVTLMTDMMRAQRVALGQPAGGFTGAQAADIGKPVQEVSRMLKDLNADNISQDDAIKSTDIRKLLEDPEVVRSAQDLVIRMSGLMDNAPRGTGHFLDKYQTDDDDK